MDQCWVVLVYGANAIYVEWVLILLKSLAGCPFICEYVTGFAKRILYPHYGNVTWLVVMLSALQFCGMNVLFIKPLCNQILKF